MAVRKTQMVVGLVAAGVVGGMVCLNIWIHHEIDMVSQMQITLPESTPTVETRRPQARASLSLAESNPDSLDLPIATSSSASEREVDRASSKPKMIIYELPLDEVILVQ